MTVGIGLLDDIPGPVVRELLLQIEARRVENLFLQPVIGIVFVEGRAARIVAPAGKRVWVEHRLADLVVRRVIGVRFGDTVHVGELGKPAAVVVLPRLEAQRQVRRPARGRQRPILKLHEQLVGRIVPVRLVAAIG